MVKGSIYAITAALLFTTGGIQGARAAALPVNVSKVHCEATEQWKEKLGQWNAKYNWILELLSKIEFDKVPGDNSPEQPEVPEESKPEQPGTPEESKPEKPSTPGESKPEKPVTPGESKPEQPSTPEESKPEKPNTPGESKPEKPVTPGESKPEKPSTPGESKPEKPVTPKEKPEEQDKAYVYGLRITELVNQYRAEAGLAPVEYSAELSRPAQVRAFEIEKSFSHTRPDGRYFSTALKDYDISYRYTGENIAWGQRSPEEVVEAWMNSPGHRANILHKSFTKLGVGYQQNARGVNYFTQLFTN